MTPGKCKNCETTMEPHWYSINDETSARVYVLLCPVCDMITKKPEEEQ